MPTFRASQALIANNFGRGGEGRSGFRAIDPEASYAVLVRELTEAQVGKALKEIAEAKGLSQWQVARKAKVPRSTVQRIFSGSGSGVDFTNTSKILGGIGLDWHELMDQLGVMETYRVELDQVRQRNAELLAVVFGMAKVLRDQPLPEALEREVHRLVEPPTARPPASPRGSHRRRRVSSANETTASDHTR